MELEIIAELYELASSGTDAKVIASIHTEQELGAALHVMCTLCRVDRCSFRLQDALATYQ